MEIEHALKVLGLGKEATQKDIKQVYRDLSLVWHPDRFTNNQRLQNKGEEKLKEINEAYEILKNYIPQTLTQHLPLSKNRLKNLIQLLLHHRQNLLILNLQIQSFTLRL